MFKIYPGSVSAGGLQGMTPEDAERHEDEGAVGVPGLVSWNWNVATNDVRYSREWRNILQRPDDPEVQTALAAWWPLTHEDDVQPFLEAARDIVEGVTEDYQTLFRVRRADGQWAWLLSRGRVVEKDASGNALLVCGALMDISFLRSDVKFQHGAEAMCLPLRHAPPGEGAGGGPSRPGSRQDGSAGTAFGLPREPVPVDAFAAVADVDAAQLGAEQKAFVRERVKRVFAQGRVIRETVSFNTEYGHAVTGQYVFWPEHDSEGRVTGVVSQFWDMTESLLAERRARLNEMRLDALYSLTQMNDAGEDEILAFALDSLVKLTESESGFIFFPENFPGRRGRMVWSKDHYGRFSPEDLPSDAMPAELAAIISDSEGRPYRRVVRNGNCLQPVRYMLDGRVRIMRYIVAPAFEGDRVVCIAGVRDKKNAEYREDDLDQLEAFLNGAWLVLRRHEFVRELRRAKEEAERANKIKDRFLSNVSHELRTPLNGILSMLQLLDLTQLDEQQREYVGTAGCSGQALLRIISDILDFAQIESGTMKLRAEAFDFKNAFESSLSLFRNEAEGKGLAFTARFGEGMPARLLGDDARVRQILFNIVGNALKFTEKGGIHVECSLLPHGGPDSAWVYLAVTDTGIGIPYSEQVRIFDAFTQIDSSPARKHTGTGLGLSIVRHLVGLMGGSVVAESEPGRGTTIHCSMRFAILPDPAGEAIRTEAETGEAEKPLHILVAEDDDVSRYALRMFLRRLGHVPVCVSNGRQALEMLQLYPFHCLFTDIQMPDMDGLELIRRIRENRLEGVGPSEEARELLREEIPQWREGTLEVPSDIVAVTVSAHTMKGDKERFLDAGMNFYLSKPIIMNELADVLRQVAVHLKTARR